MVPVCNKHVIPHLGEVGRGGGKRGGGGGGRGA